MFSQNELVQTAPNLHKFALRLTRNGADADDLLQSTLLRAIEKQDLFEPGTSLFRWTSKIMFNIFASGYRRKTKFETQYDPERVLDSQSVDATQEMACDLKQVKAAMNRLSNDHRDILVLVCVMGMRYEEVAKALSVPIGTVRSRLSRARENLQHLLEPTATGAIPPYQPAAPHQHVAA